MNQKEVNELRRRLQPGKTTIANIYGCYVNKGEIVSDLDEPLGLMPEEEAGQFLGLLKKSLSGRLGRNLMDIVFSTQQVMDSEEHRLLMGLRDSELKDGEKREAFYRKVIESLDMGDSNYLIVLAYDAYDVPYHGKDGMRQADNSDLLYRYILCSVCPVKEGKISLEYYAGDNEFHNCLASQIVGAPEVGFLFPAFDDRTANIYNVLYYARKPEELHHEFIDGLFKAESPLSAAEQKEMFQAVLADSGLSRMELVRSVYEELQTRINAHRESREEEPLTVSAKDLAGILVDYGAGEEETNRFLQNYADQFGEGVVLSPENLIDRQFQLKIDNTTVSVGAEYSQCVQTKVLEGKTYIIIPAGGAAEINGFPVQV